MLLFFSGMCYNQKMTWAVSLNVANGNEYLRAKNVMPIYVDAGF